MQRLKRDQVRALSRVKSGFPLGAVWVTPAVAKKVTLEEITAAISRHGAGDWGEVSHDDVIANERALERGARLVSSYAASSGATFWIITEADRSVTTVFLPEEY